MLAFKTSWHFSHSHTQLYNKQHEKTVQMSHSNIPDYQSDTFEFFFSQTEIVHFYMGMNSHHSGIQWFMKITKATKQRSAERLERSGDATRHNEFVFHLISLISVLIGSSWLPVRLPGYQKCSSSLSLVGLLFLQNKHRTTVLPQFALASHRKNNLASFHTEGLQADLLHNKLFNSFVSCFSHIL